MRTSDVTTRKFNEVKLVKYDEVFGLSTLYFFFLKFYFARSALLFTDVAVVFMFVVNTVSYFETSAMGGNTKLLSTFDI